MYYLSLDILQSIKAFSQVLITINGNCMADDGEGVNPLLSACLLRSTRLLKDIC